MNKKIDFKVLFEKLVKLISPGENRTVEEQSKYIFSVTISIALAVTVLMAIGNIVAISMYKPADSSTIDTSKVDTIKKFIQTESTDKYKEMISRHSNEEKNKRLDIQTVFSSTGRDYPFTPILNKSIDNTSTKLCKFIYSELKPAIISYKLANGSLPVKVGEDGVPTKEVDLELLANLINIKDTSIEGFTYFVSDNMDSNNVYISVYKGDTEFPIVLFDATQFKVAEINKNEVNLVQGKHSLVLKPMEEYNNIRVQKIDMSTNTVTLADTITNKIVKISK